MRYLHHLVVELRKWCGLCRSRRASLKSNCKIQSKSIAHSPSVHNTWTHTDTRLTTCWLTGALRTNPSITKPYPCQTNLKIVKSKPCRNVCSQRLTYNQIDDIDLNMDKTLWLSGGNDLVGSTISSSTLLLTIYNWCF